LDEKVLRRMNKALTVSQITEGVKKYYCLWISPGFNIIFGNIGETIKSLKLGVEFLLKYDDQAQMRTIRPVTPYPGSPLYYYAIKKGLLKDCADFYENKHINSDLLSVNFTDLTDDEFHRALMEANLKLLDNYFEKTKKVIHAQTGNYILTKMKVLEDIDTHRIKGGRKWQFLFIAEKLALIIMEILVSLNS